MLENNYFYPLNIIFILLSTLINSGFLKKGFAIIVLRFLGVLLSFGGLMLITNLFPDDEVGRYQYLNSIIITVGTVVLLGLNVSFIRFAGELFATQKQYEFKRLYTRNVIIISIMTLIFVLFYFIFRFLFPEIINAADDRIYKMSLLALFPHAIAVLNFQVLLGLNRLYLSEFFRNVIKFITIIIFVLLFYFLNKHDQLLEAFIWSLWLVAILSTLFVWFRLNDFKTETIIEDSISYRKILKVSIPMILSFISLLLMQQMDLLVLKEFTAYENLAYYGVAVKISMVLSIVLTAVNQVIGPQLAEFYFKGDKNGIKSIVDKSIILNNALTIPIIIVIMIIPETVLSFFGENYYVAKNALLILLIGQGINGIMGSTDLYLNMTGKQNYFQKIIFMALIINLILNFILVPKWGMTGAATATAVSLIFWNILGVIYVYRVDGVVLVLNFALIKNLIHKK